MAATSSRSLKGLYKDLNWRARAAVFEFIRFLISYRPWNDMNEDFNCIWCGKPILLRKLYCSNKCAKSDFEVFLSDCLCCEQNDNDKTLSQALKDAKSILKLKDRDVAFDLEVPPSSIDRWRRGVTYPLPSVRKIVYRYLLEKCK